MKTYGWILLFCLYSFAVSAQTYRARMETAIDIGTHSTFFTYTDTRNTGDYTDDYTHLYYDHYTDEFYYRDAPPARDVFHKITITKSMDLHFTYNGSTFLQGVLFYILDADGNQTRFYAEHSPSNTPFTRNIELMPGTYYIVSEANTMNWGYENDIGTLKLTIEARARKDGEDFFYPHSFGTFNSGFTTSHIVPNVFYYMCDYEPAEPLNNYDIRKDLVHQFTITEPMEISIDNIGSGRADSPFNIKLLSSSMDTINVESVSGTHENTKRWYDLEPGTYFVYSRFLMYNGKYVINLNGTLTIPGSSFNSPIQIGSKSETFTYSHTQNTSLFSKSRISSKPGKEAFYKLILTRPMEITIDNCGSAIVDTYLHVFSEDRRLLYSNDNYSGTGACANTQNAYIKIPVLLPGTYYVVSDGASNGNITTTIKGKTIGPEGDLMITAIDAGTHEVGFLFSDTQNTASGFSNQFTGKPTNDVFYKFRLTQPVDITISHCGSAVADTYMSVLNAAGSIIYSNDNYTGEGKCASTGNSVIKIPQMPAGTYYVVSEGNSQNGSITTTIKGTSAFANLNTTKGQPNIVSITPMVETSDLLTLDADEIQLNIQYYNHFGEPVVTIQPNLAPSGGDFVTLQESDGLFRESKVWLPVVKSTNGGKYVFPNEIKSTARSAAAYNDQRPYSEIVYNPKSLDLVAAQYGPGNDWYTNARAVNTDRMVNHGTTGELACARYVTGGTPSAPTFSKTGFYANSELFVTRQSDEDNNVTYEFTDKAGRTILIRQMNGTVPHDTYYVYDRYGNTCFVLPPAASDALTATNTTWSEATSAVKDYAYVYRYDGLNRCIRKKLPGCDPVEMRYDKADRLIFSQDGNRKQENEWTFFLYDVFGRPVVTGIWESPTVPNLDNIVVRADFNTGADGARLGGYKATGLTPPSAIRLLSVNYYDDYRFLDLQMSARKDSLSFSDEGYLDRHMGARGLLTGSRTYRLDDPAKYSVAATYYDHLGRVVQSRASNHMGGYDKEYFDYTFSGKVLKRKLVHSAPPQPARTEVYTYSYDHAERLLSVSHKLDNAPTVTMAEYTYDQTGRLKTRQLHETVDTTTYDYNIRDWVTRISGSKFNQTLAYNTSTNDITPTKALFSGNISAMKWQSGNETTERGYQFAYDGMNRLASATYGEGPSITSNINRFNEVIAYNKMGNITSLQRRGKLDSGYGLIDNLTYTYSGNQLIKVSDAVTAPITYQGAFHFVDGANAPVEYEYDNNGNLKKDLNKNITAITYNELNLPSIITFSDGKSITYGYDASGRKLSVVYRSGSTVTKMEYIGNKVYNNGTLSMLLTEEGYISQGTTPVYHYYLKDHQGNNRVVINQAGEVQQVNHYYPFGGIFGEGMQDSNQRYKYSGKEFDREFNLDMSDHGARHYDPALGRWFNVDPLAEKYYSLSPYVYVANNPIRFIDPDGMAVRIANNVPRALKNLARIAATYYGEEVLSQLINSEKTYATKSIFRSKNSEYTSNRTIYFVGHSLRPTMDGAYASSMLFMGHEIYHAFQDDNKQIRWYDRGEKVSNVLEMERGAVGFENYLRSVYGYSPMREKYQRLEGGDRNSFNPYSFDQDEERITNFTKLGNNKSKSSFGFSYDKKTSKKATQRFFIIVSIDDKDNFSFRIYGSEEEYEDASSNW